MEKHFQVLMDSEPGGKPRQRPEWLRISEAVKLFGLSRSKLYELIAKRRIKSFCLRERNAIKGIRLISFDSLDQFLEGEAQRERKEVAP